MPVTDDSVACEPGRCIDDISVVIKQHRSETRGCYDAARKANPALGAGELVIKYEIDPAGKIIDAQQGNQEHQLEAPELAECLANVMRSITFKAGTKRTRGYHRFEFSGTAAQ